MDEDADLVHAIYACALEERPWGDVVGAAMRMFGATSSALFTAFLPASEGGLFIAQGLPDEAVRQYLSEVAEVDEWYLALLRRYGKLHTGFTYRTGAIVAERELRRTRFYADYMRRLDLAECLGAIVGDGAAPDSPEMVFTLYRPFGSPAFTPHDVQRFGDLQRHLTRAMSIRSRLRSALCGTMGLALDRLTTPVLVLGRNRKILLANPAAQRLLASPTEPLVRGGLLRAQEPAQTHALDAALNACAAHGLRTPVPLSIRLSGPPGAGIVARLAPPPEAAPAGTLAAAVAILAREGRTVVDAKSIVAALYRLSPAEAALVQGMADGLTPEAYAASRQVSRTTVKTQLKSVFAKTGTRRQSDLMRLVLSVAH